eukprot:4644669-Lingulodinium_polyedra.AAC.1
MQGWATSKSGRQLARWAATLVSAEAGRTRRRGAQQHTWAKSLSPARLDVLERAHLPALAAAATTRQPP